MTLKELEQSNEIRGRCATCRYWKKYNGAQEELCKAGTCDFMRYMTDENFYCAIYTKKREK